MKGIDELEHRAHPAVTSRRSIIMAGVALLGFSLSGIRSLHAKTSRAAASSIDVLQLRFDDMLTHFRASLTLLESTRSDREAQILTSPYAPGQERAPIRTAPSQTAISVRATDLIIACEVTSQRKYEQSYRRPTWPRGQSGVTIGVGYDVGYVTTNWLNEDWHEYISDNAIQSLSIACGVTGDRAQSLNLGLQDVVIDWPAANRQFLEKEQPRYVGETEHALPNTNLLSPNSLGALTSLTYNRGPAFAIPYDANRDSQDRYREMRAIKEHMTSKNFALIPREIRSMKRLWISDPSMRGLISRRELEAVLFELGLRE